MQVKLQELAIFVWALAHQASWRRAQGEERQEWLHAAAPAFFYASLPTMQFFNGQVGLLLNCLAGR